MNFCRQAGWGIVVFLMVIGAFPLFAKTLTFDKEKCQIDVPDNWTKSPGRSDNVDLVNAEQTKLFTLRIIPTGFGLDAADPSFSQSIEKALVNELGFTIMNSEPVTVAGVEGIEIYSTGTTNKGDEYSRAVAISANGNAYELTVSKVGSATSEDDELNAIINSFRFIGSPVLHHRPIWSGWSEIAYVIIQIFFAVLTIVLVVRRYGRRPNPYGPPPR